MVVFCAAVVVFCAAAVVFCAAAVVFCAAAVVFCAAAAVVVFVFKAQYTKYNEISLESDGSNTTVR